MADKELTPGQKEQIQKDMEKLGPGDTEIETTSFYGDKASTKEMEDILDKEERDS